MPKSNPIRSVTVDRWGGRDVSPVTRVAPADAEEFVQRLTGSIPRVFRAAVAILGDSQEAEDAVQEAAIVAFRSIMTLRNKQAFHTWFLRIAVNKAKDMLRRRKREQERAFALSQVPVSRSEVDVETAMDVVQAVEQLPDCHRTVVRLYYAGGYSTPEIARMLDRPEGTVRRLLSESYRMLRQLI